MISYTPNLKYLNVESEPPYRYNKSIYKTDIKLKQLYLTLSKDSSVEIDFNQLTDGIKQFSSSLNCLSLNLVSINMTTTNEIPFNSKKLQQFLESIRELKQFHVYAKLDEYRISDFILSQFKSQY